ncbi:MAG: flagellar hook-basal body complex protein [Lachnospiraceae bacterium]|nr:flagellar hook-basal body complex protein [Lachnospiraceae bacterium]
MMRSLYSGVAGLKTHQTKMDVIGNNIANVNTVGFKSSSVNFSDTFYQTVSSSTGPNATMGTAGTNAKQIGLGSLVASITTNITENGGTSTTNRALDLAINGESFLIVNTGTERLFTKSGALNVDEAGNLYCTTNGGIIQGWLADADGNIVKDTVKDLKIMTAEQMYAAPTATSDITLSGNIDPNDKNLTPTTEADGSISGGIVMTFSFYDNLGELYTVKMRTTKDETQDSTETIKYTTRVEDVLDSNGDSIFVKKNVDETTGKVTYTATGAQITFGGVAGGVSAAGVNADTGEFVLDAKLAQPLTFNSATGAFAAVCPNRDSKEYAGNSINFSVIQKDTEHTGSNSTFPQYDAATDSGGIEINFSALTQYSKGGTSDTTYKKGTGDGYGAGNYAGSMNGISIDEQGKIYGHYTNNETKCLGQIAVASFSNPSGLEARGDSLFAASLNSGLFDGVGEEIALSGSFTPGALEMSNVDLATEFTQMITTQRGFQANSRIITTSDTMLEELVNLKR